MTYWSWGISYLVHYKWRSLLMIFSLGMLVYLPLGLNKLNTEAEAKLIDRAESTDLLVLPSNGGLDEILEILYFKGSANNSFIKYAQLDSLNESGLGFGIPILTGFQAQDYPIVGTSLDYFDYRSLSISQGKSFSLIGDCVLGNDLASDLNLKIGDTFSSSPESFIDIAGNYPLKMTVRGILNKSHTPDDRAVFVDYKTTWVIMGLGHGHENVEDIKDPSLAIQDSDTSLRVNSKLNIYQEISEANLDEFHFHGDIEDYPLRGLIFVPDNHKAETILRGRYSDNETRLKIIVPEQGIDQLLKRIFKLNVLLQVIFSWVALAIVLVFVLVVILSIKLRAEQIQTLKFIGFGRVQIFSIFIAELMLVILFSTLISSILYLLTGLFIPFYLNLLI